MLSLLTLAVYTLFVFHDLIPHSHASDPDTEQHAHEVVRVQHHKHGHQNAHHHHSHEEENSNTPSSTGDIADQLISNHHHPGDGSHHHELSYRTTTKNELILPKDAPQKFIVDQTYRTHLPTDHLFKRSQLTEPFNHPYLSSNIGLRAPPALG